MKQYRLKKDLLSIKAGALFIVNYETGYIELDENNLNDERKIRANWRFPIGLIDKETFNDWFEEVEKTNDEVKNKTPQIFNRVGELNFNIKSYLEYLIARQTVIDSAKGFKPDWKDNEQVKYSVSYDYYKNKYFINEQGNYQDFGVIYFATEEDAEASLKNFPNEWEILREWGQR